MNNKIKNPKVFISYSWTSPEYEDRVVELAKKLTSDGILVVFDKWDLKEGQDKNVFMEQMVTEASVLKVLMLCDEGYKAKADKRKGGVGTESQIISEEIYSKVKQEKFIPVIMQVGEDGKPFLPVYLKSRIYINLSSQQHFYSEYEKLIRNIFGKPIFQKPEIGTPPSYVTEEIQLSLKSNHKFDTFKDSFINDKRNSTCLCLDYLDSLIKIFHDFQLRPKEGVEFDDQLVESIRLFKPYRDQFIQFIHLLCNYSSDNTYYEKVFEFLERSLRFKYAPEGLNSYNEIWFDNYRFIIRELFLYLIAMLIKYKKITEACYFLEEKYFYKTNTNKQESYYYCFNASISTLDELRNKRLKLNRISVTADLIKDGCDSEYLSFEDIMQTDFILTIRGLISKNDQHAIWYPRTLVYAERFDMSGFDLFHRAHTKRYFDIVKKILCIENKSDLVNRLEEANKVYQFTNWRLGIWPIKFSSLLNIEKLYDAQTL